MLLTHAAMYAAAVSGTPGVLPSTSRHLPMVRTDEGTQAIGAGNASLTGVAGGVRYLETVVQRDAMALHALVSGDVQDAGHVTSALHGLLCRFETFRPPRDSVGCTTAAMRDAVETAVDAAMPTADQASALFLQNMERHPSVRSVAAAAISRQPHSGEVDLQVGDARCPYTVAVTCAAQADGVTQRQGNVLHTPSLLGPLLAKTFRLNVDELFQRMRETPEDILRYPAITAAAKLGANLMDCHHLASLTKWLRLLRKLLSPTILLQHVKDQSIEQVIHELLSGDEQVDCLDAADSALGVLNIFRTRELRIAHGCAEVSHAFYPESDLTLQDTFEWLWPAPGTVGEFIRGLTYTLASAVHNAFLIAAHNGHCPSASPIPVEDVEDLHVVTLSREQLSRWVELCTISGGKFNYDLLERLLRNAAPREMAHIVADVVPFELGARLRGSVAL